VTCPTARKPARRGAPGAALHPRLSVAAAAAAAQTEVTVRVQDSLPEATHKDLKVTLQEKTTAGSNGAKVSFKQADAQQLEWEVTLPPGATQTLTAKFTIEWPKDKEVGGLCRNPPLRRTLSRLPLAQCASVLWVWCTAV